MIITFDLYGTLVDWEYTITSYMNFIKANPKEFFECEINELKQFRKYSEILKLCLKKILKEKYSEELGEGLIYAFSKSPPFPDTVLGLRKLRKIAKLGIISNTERKLIKITLYGIEDLFDWIITAEDTGYYKPDENAFIKAYNMMGVDPKDVIHVSAYPQYDLETAKNIVKTTILVNRYGYDWPIKVNNIIEISEMM
ncbi:MAG: HAD-IA family hydrolase [Saccharolobus sp.]|jgi:2-haloacid dehalogenase|uniref:HAD-IA family hydrolase n=1 Tax=Saccharolobus sp. TaxID=2100761 RepID=UPI0028CC05FB|nr:HAD-IA family hydrolase [Saccharolobus sp.]MDT7862298.1 HAD-IA family hydrolase [Saccharolobus sp.]